MPRRGGVVVKFEHTPDTYIANREEGEKDARKNLEWEAASKKAILAGKHRRECKGKVTKFGWCSDALCRMWFDMTEYFGFSSDDIVDTDIDSAILSVADGGSGIYERLLVLGHRIIDSSSKEYAVTKYIRSGLEGVPTGSEEILNEQNKKLLVFLKMRWFTNNATSVMTLSKFGRRYLHYCQAEINNASPSWNDSRISKYIKFCIAFCLYWQGCFDWNNPLHTEVYITEQFPWLQHFTRLIDIGIITPAVQHEGILVSIDKLRNEKLLNILWQYFGYDKVKTTVPPRITYILGTPEGITLPEERTGEAIINHYIGHYLKAIATEHGLKGVDALHWVEREKNAIIESHAIELFSLIDLEMGELYFNGSSGSSKKKFQRYKSLLFSMVANMYVLSDQDEVAQIWIQEMVSQIRQIQLYIIEFQDIVANADSIKDSFFKNVSVGSNTLAYSYVPKILMPSEHEEEVSLLNIFDSQGTQAISALKKYLTTSKEYIRNLKNKISVSDWFKKGFVSCATYIYNDKQNIPFLEVSSKALSHEYTTNIESNEVNLEDKSEQLLINEETNKHIIKEEPEYHSHIHCSKVLSPILAPVTMQLSSDHPKLEIRPISLTLINDKGEPVNFTLNANSKILDGGVIKPLKDINSSYNIRTIESREELTLTSQDLNKHKTSIFSRNINKHQNDYLSSVRNSWNAATDYITNSQHFRSCTMQGYGCNTPSVSFKLPRTNPFQVYTTENH
ncbi:hypothetical protein cand_020540 [Cryptosporidium andersoni]|uniref:Uncharacterized protein n=1 Tax=Cryptosporidium andersoni TaxID=117008 RepID=A0A1J4MSR6_9CRYT|nr:hypothetical protein cand_020540 [Cryptosporidium andersoni]